MSVFQGSVGSGSTVDPSRFNKIEDSYYDDSVMIGGGKAVPTPTECYVEDDSGACVSGDRISLGLDVEGCFAFCQWRYSSGSTKSYKQLN